MRVDSSGKKQLPRSEAAMAEATDLGPITLQLDGHHLTFEDCVWLPDYDAEIPARGDAMEQELVQLRRERRVMKKELDRYSAQTQEMKNLKERWNLLDFKYQLLLDMWTMKSLDSKRDKSTSPRRADQRHHSPRRHHHRHSTDRTERNKDGSQQHSPSKKERHSPRHRQSQNGRESPALEDDD
ncbi:unnamed protein product [Sphagnum jensenii]|uniref:Uncharacterized protein n=1 Tax=Sphagnum jensenii TaxID=128206 RepID=A0ABP0WLN5_9BRYO